MTWLYIIAAALGGIILTLPATLWAYRAGHADGRLAERTRWLARDLRRARQMAKRDREAWVVFDAAEELPAAQREQLAAPDDGPYLVRETKPQLQLVTGWDMPARTAWTGPMQRADA